jgi:hypothetical protein
MVCHQNRMPSLATEGVHIGILGHTTEAECQAACVSVRSTSSHRGAADSAGIAGVTLGEKCTGVAYSLAQKQCWLKSNFNQGSAEFNDAQGFQFCHFNQFNHLAGYPEGVAEADAVYADLAAAQARCLELGGACGGVVEKSRSALRPHPATGGAARFEVRKGGTPEDCTPVGGTVASADYVAVTPFVKVCLEAAVEERLAAAALALEVRKEQAVERRKTEALLDIVGLYRARLAGAAAHTLLADPGGLATTTYPSITATATTAGDGAAAAAPADVRVGSVTAEMAPALAAAGGAASIAPPDADGRRGDEVRRVVWTFWFGSAMTANRLEALESLRKSLGVPVQLVTDETLHLYNVTGAPFHPAMAFLSGVHKGDYLRSYFMHHFGGGYHDIKFHSKDDGWREAFLQMDADDRLWLMAPKEEGGLGCGQRVLETLPCYGGDPQCTCDDIYRDMDVLVSNCAYIARPNTPFTQRWHGTVNAALDAKLERLRASTPLPYSKCCLDPQVIAETGYPMTWTEIHGDVYHPLVWHFRGQGHIDNGLPGYSSKSWI